MIFSILRLIHRYDDTIKVILTMFNKNPLAQKFFLARTVI